MSHLTQLKFSELNLNNADESKELSVHQTKLISGGTYKFYASKSSRGYIEVREDKISDSAALLIGLEVARYSEGEISLYKAEDNARKILGLDGDSRLISMGYVNDN